MSTTKKSTEETAKARPGKKPEKIEPEQESLKEEDLKDVHGGARGWPTKGF